MKERTVFLCCREAGMFRRLARRAAMAWLFPAILAVLAQLAAGAERVMLKIGDPPPSFSLQDLDGRTVTPADFKGKAVVMHFWADWCTYCLEEMPVLDSLYRQYQGQGLMIYAVNVGQGRDAAKAFVQKMKVAYPVLLDTDSRTAKSYGVLGFPRTFFIDRKGNIKYKLLGEASGETLRKLVLNTL
jgi:cytochrome c biogenesis protein CcmG, thiol:disulfide interchange protein DsbE